MMAEKERLEPGTPQLRLRAAAPAGGLRPAAAAPASGELSEARDRAAGARADRPRRAHRARWPEARRRDRQPALGPAACAPATTRATSPGRWSATPTSTPRGSPTSSRDARSPTCARGGGAAARPDHDPRGMSATSNRSSILFLGLPLLAAAAMGCTHAAPRGPGLDTVTARWPLAPTSGRVGDDSVRLRFTAGQETLELGATWTEGGLDEAGIRLRTAALVTLPEGHRRTMPGPNQDLLILGVDSWRRFARQVGESFVAPQPGSIAVLDLDDGEHLLLRRDDGAVANLSAGGSACSRRRRAPPGDPGALPGRGDASGRDLRDRERPPQPPPAPVPGRRRGTAWGVRPPRPGPPAVRRLPLAAGSAPAVAGSLGRTAETLSALTLEAHVIALIKNPVSSIGRLLNILAQCRRRHPRSRRRLPVPLAPPADAPPTDHGGRRSSGSSTELTRTATGGARSGC